jgi:hypothetical protein
MSVEPTLMKMVVPEVGHDLVDPEPPQPTSEKWLLLLPALSGRHHLSLSLFLGYYQGCDVCHGIFVFWLALMIDPLQLSRTFTNSLKTNSWTVFQSQRCTNYLVFLFLWRSCQSKGDLSTADFLCMRVLWKC